MAARYEVVKPEVAVIQSEDYVAALYLTLQLALREVVGGAAIEQVLETRSQLGERLFELTREPVEKLGLNLMSVNIRDIMFPGELKRIFAQVVEARQEGLWRPWSGPGERPPPCAAWPTRRRWPPTTRPCSSSGCSSSWGSREATRWCSATRAGDPLPVVVEGPKQAPQDSGGA